MMSGLVVPFAAVPLPRAQRVAVRTASFGIVAVLLALGACAVWGVAATTWADVAVKRATAASNAMAEARLGIGAERSHREGGSALAAAVVSSLNTAHVFTEGVNRRLIDELTARHGLYLEANDPAALAGLETDADLVLQRLRVEALGLLQTLVATQTRFFIGGPVLFALGLLLVGAIWRMQRSEQRRGTIRLMQAADDAKREDRRYHGVVQNAPDPLLICAGPGNLLYENAAARDAWSFGGVELESQSILMLAHPDDRPALQVWWEQLRPASACRANEKSRRMELQLRDASGSWRQAELVGTNLLDDPEVQGIVLVIRDAETRHALAAQRADLVLLDPQTRLPNALLLRDRLGQALARAGRRTDMVGVLSIRLDGMDGLADEADDALTLAAATRIKTCVRPQDTVARLDRTTFVIVRDVVADQADAVATAQAVAAQFSSALRVRDHHLALMPRIGLALGTPRQDVPDNLLRNAGLAMEQVRPDAIQRHVVFQAGIRSETLDRIELEGDLRGAVQRLLRNEAPLDDMPPEFRVHYQPIVALQTGSVHGVEALIRWQHQRHGVIASRDLIPMAEETGLIVSLGQWVLEEACRQVRHWQQRSRLEAALTLSVNLSSLQFQQPDLVADVTRALAEGGLAPGCLRLEVTEATIMNDPDHAVRTLWRLKALGVELAIDDFGMGYSALPYLRQLPIGQLKIDSSFVSGIGKDQEAISTVRAIMSLAKSLGWDVTAEGIETAAQAAILLDWGCDCGQGYHFGRPLDGPATGYLLQSPTVSPGPVRRRVAVPEAS